MKRPEWAKGVKPEMTAEMHYDLLQCECSHLEVMIMGAYSATKKGVSLTDACAKYKISIKDFILHYSEVFPGSSFEEDFPSF